MDKKRRWNAFLWLKLEYVCIQCNDAWEIGGSKSCAIDEHKYIRGHILSNEKMGDTERNWHIIDWHGSMRKPNHLLKLILIHMHTVDIPIVFCGTVSLVTCCRCMNHGDREKNQWTPVKPYVSHRVQYTQMRKVCNLLIRLLFLSFYSSLIRIEWRDCTIISHFVALSTVNWYMEAPKWCVDIHTRHTSCKY